MHGTGELVFQTLLPRRIERGVHVQPAQLDVAILQQAVEFALGGLEGIRRLIEGVAIIGCQLERFRGDGIAALGGDESHGCHAFEGLPALRECRLWPASGRENVRPADDAGEQCALGSGQLARRLAEIRACRLLDAICASPEVDAVEVMREDFVLRVLVFETQCDGDLEKLAMQGFLPDFKTVAGKLHAQRGSPLREIAVLEVAQCGTRQPA